MQIGEFIIKQNKINRRISIWHKEKIVYSITGQCLFSEEDLRVTLVCYIEGQALLARQVNGEQMFTVIYKQDEKSCITKAISIKKIERGVSISLLDFDYDLVVIEPKVRCDEILRDVYTNGKVNLEDDCVFQAFPSYLIPINPNIENNTENLISQEGGKDV